MKWFLFFVGFGSLLTAGNHGLLPLKDHEKHHLENRVPKVVNVTFNSLGVTRMQEHYALHPSSESETLAVGEQEFYQMTISSEEAVQQIPLQATLPTSVNNSLLPSFPPIGDQGQLGSCVAWGSTYYQATHEIGLLNQVNNKSGQQGILSPKWTYDILNGGVDDGLSPLTAFQLLSINGAASLSSFPYNTNYTAWDLNSQDWVAAINNRMATYALIPGLGGSGAQNLTAIKTALVNGHVLTFATFIDSWVFTNIKTDPQNIDNNYVGELAAIYMDGTDGGHFMTIVGYDDNLWIDINGNGEVDPGERGAFLIANSWASSWGNAGFVWISYDAFLATSGVAGGPNKGRVAAGTYLNSDVITVVPKAQNYTPSLIAEFSLSQSERNQIAIQAGVSNTTQTTPTTTLADYALTNQGGALEFSGASPGAAQSLTFALDLSDFLTPSTSGQMQRYYLTVSDDAAGPSTVLNSYSLVDLVHNTQIAASNLPKTYDNTSGSVYLDYNFSPGPAPTPSGPSISFVSPESDATLSGTVTVSAEITDSVAISTAELYVDSTLVGTMTATASAYTASLDTTKFANGSHQLEVIATDTGDLTAQSLLTVQIENTALSVSFVSPQSNATLSGTVTVSAEITDSLAISSADLYVDSTLVGAMTAEASAYTASLDTDTFTNGSHQLKIVATDAANRTAQSLLTVQMENNTVPLPSFYVNAGGSALSSQGQTWTTDAGYFTGKTGVYSNALSFANPVYQTERYANNMMYHFTVPNGVYLVTLKFSEIFFRHKNQRVFSVAINGSPVITNLDLNAAAGYGVPYDQQFPVTVTNGAITIAFTSLINNSQLNGISIVPAP
jgi:hypothetical protein